MKEFGPSYKKGRQLRSTKKDRIREISKEIKKCIRENKRKKRQVKIQKIMEKVKGTKNISSIKSVKKRILILKVKNKEGEAVKTRQGIANVFAKFYEDLYKGEDDYNDEDMSSCTEPRKCGLQPNRNHSQSSQQKRSKQPSIDWKKEGRKTAMEYDRNNWKSAALIRKKR